MATTGVDAPGRAQIGAKTLRTDRWWIQPAITWAMLTAFVVYSAWRVFSGEFYYASPYVSVYFSPCLATDCAEGALPGGPISWWWLSPALLTAWIPLTFRFSCYYYRKAYYRSFWMSPPACAVSEPHGKYTGERRLPLILNNVHRYTFYLALVLNVVLTLDAILAFRTPNEYQWGYVGLGTLILTANAAALWFYTLSCHSCRNAVGGRITHFSKHPVRYKMWTLVSKLNAHHMQWAWISLFTVVLADFYVYLLASGRITDIVFFSV